MPAASNGTFGHPATHFWVQVCTYSAHLLRFPPRAIFYYKACPGHCSPSSHRTSLTSWFCAKIRHPLASPPSQVAFMSDELSMHMLCLPTTRLSLSVSHLFLPCPPFYISCPPFLFQFSLHFHLLLVLYCSFSLIC